MFIIDGHAHVYPDKIASKASKAIGEFYGVEMAADGTVAALLADGEKSGVAMRLIHSVATAPDKVLSINNFIAKTVAAIEFRQ